MKEVLQELAGRSYTVELIRCRDLSPTVRSFEFRFADVDRFEFEPGQSIAIEFTLEGSQHSRPYSIASPPRGDNTLEICARFNPGGPGTRFLWALEPGARFTVTGPRGSFRLQSSRIRDCIFIAAGTGIAPLRSMLYALLEREEEPHVTLLFGVRDQADCLYNEEFVALARRNKNFSYRTVLSRPSNGWGGLRGYVQHHVEDAVNNRTALDVYVSGMTEMVEEVRQMLLDLGLDEKSIHYEKSS